MKSILQKSGRQIGTCIVLLASFPMMPLLHAQGGGTAKKESDDAMVRLLCVSSLTENEKVILATKSEEGDWREHGELTLRSPFITDWTKVPRGVVHLAKRSNENLTSIAVFKSTPTQKRAIVVLRPDQKNNRYRTTLIDPTKLDFGKGKALVINYSTIPAVVKLGGKQRLVKPGERITEKINAGNDRMYRMLVGYRNEDDVLVPCYDRFVSGNPKTRKFLLLFPDPSSQIRVFSLSEFGPFE